jgi:hypothetical protein
MQEGRRAQGAALFYVRERYAVELRIYFSATRYVW